MQARDGSSAFWYNAKIIKKTGRGASVAAIVQFISFPSSHNQKKTAGMQALRVRLSASELKYEQRAAEAQGSTVGLQPNGEWKIEKLLKLRRRNGATEALVRWDGWAVSCLMCGHASRRERCQTETVSCGC